MIMNKKIFTLLAGVLLMLATVFSVSAQGTGYTPDPPSDGPSLVNASRNNTYLNLGVNIGELSDELQQLSFGNRVNDLNLGGNNYYHLRVTAVNDYAGNYYTVPQGNSPAQGNYVLYLGKKQTDGSYPLFLSQLGKAREGLGATLADKYFNTTSKAEESAASLWCTVVNDFNQGQNITFDFINKQQKNQMLEVDVNEYPGWSWKRLGIPGGSNGKYYYNNEMAIVPGGISAWDFSPTYKGIVYESRPLFSYITTDTVAVLCWDDVNNTQQFQFGNTSAPDYVNVTIKIASANDVKNNLIPGMLYFTLYEAAPFVLNATDFNTMFGDVKADFRKLIFDPTSNPKTGSNANPNYFEDGLAAQYIPDFYGGVIYRFFPSSISNNVVVNPPNPMEYSVMLRSSHWLDQMGYMFLYKKGTTSKKDYLYVQHQYQDDNAGGSQFLKLGFREVPKETASLNVGGSSTQPPFGAAETKGMANITGFDQLVNDGNLLVNLTLDELIKERLLIGQTVWRLVYYPSGDSIYINPYQATYLPLFAPQVMDAYGLENKADDWYSIEAQSDSLFTYRAHYNTLDQTDVTTTTSDLTADQAAKFQITRLKYGIDPVKSVMNSHNAFRMFHKLYVEIQNLTSSVRVVTLGNGYANRTISTHINFGNYIECKEGAGKSIRTSVLSDLYLIRTRINNVDYFLRIPLHSADDTAEWWAIEPDERPDLMPSFQWVVMRRHENSSTSQIQFINREFDHTKYGYIQLYNTEMTKFDAPTTAYYAWNNKPVNHLTTSLADYKGNGSTFIALPRVIKENKFLGYEYISRDQALVNVYSLNYSHEYDQTRYVDWKGDYWRYPNTDTTVYVSAQGASDRLYFKLDTAANYNDDGDGYGLEPYGFNPKEWPKKIDYLVQLERQPYKLNLEDRYKLICAECFSLINGTQQEYAMGNREIANGNYLGTPIFNLRHTYFKTGANGETVPYFALVQRLNRNLYTRLVPTATAGADDRAAFDAFLKRTTNLEIAAIIKNVLDNAPRHTNNDYFKTGVFVAGVENQTTKLKFMLRADEATTVSTFRLVPDNDPIYRRFNSAQHDSEFEGDDSPKNALRFHWTDRPSFELFENTGKLAGQVQYWENYGIGTVKTPGRKNYLGSVNSLQYPNDPDPAALGKSQTAIYLDTAYIRRGTGPVKPQYLLVVDPTWPDKTVICDENGDIKESYENYLRGRFLINATDSARGVGTAANWNTIRLLNGENEGRNYLWDQSWERLIFTDAIHSYVKDALYLVGGINLANYMYPGTDIVDISKLDAASARYDTLTSAARPVRKIFLGNNDHKDAVFQMRLIERGSKEFILESETGLPENVTGISGTSGYANFNRIWGTSYGQLNSNGPMIAPCAGGWVKDQNGPAIISRSDQVFNLGNALKLNVRKTEDWPTGNEVFVAAAPTVIGGNNAVNILGAAGKKVVITNILGQTVAGTVLTSDNATIFAPKGVVVVAIEGEAAVKTLVK